MGILNITPDSFSDGGRYLDPEEAVRHALIMVQEGARIIDCGGESTRPGSASVPDKEQIARILPVIERLASLSDVTLSVDTTRPAVAEAAISRGATMVNDVSMLRDGPELAEVVARHRGVELVLMHSRSTPSDMADHTKYEDVVGEVLAELELAVSVAVRSGVARERIWLDPGIGFAKTALQSIELLARLPELVSRGHPVLVGPSRKSFIGQMTGAPVDNRIWGTAAAVTAAVLGGARCLRVHDVAPMVQTVTIAHQIARARVSRGDGNV